MEAGALGAEADADDAALAEQAASVETAESAAAHRISTG